MGSGYSEDFLLGFQPPHPPRSDFGAGHDQFLLENSANRALDLVQFSSSGQAEYSSVVTLGLFSFVGHGDYLAEGHDQFLTDVSVLTTSWKTVETGDFLGNGHDQFLIQNTSGVVELGDFEAGHLHLTQVADLGPAWAFH